MAITIVNSDTGAVTGDVDTRLLPARLGRLLRTAGVEVVEVDRPNRQARRRHGKSNPVDAVEAARAAQSGRACGAAKTRDGNVEAIRRPRGGQAERHWRTLTISWTVARSQSHRTTTTDGSPGGRCQAAPTPGVWCYPSRRVLPRVLGHGSASPGAAEYVRPESCPVR